MLTAKQQEHFEKVLEKAKITPSIQPLCKNCHCNMYGAGIYESINPVTSPIMVREAKRYMAEKYIQVVFFIKCPYCNTLHIASYDVNPQTYENYCQSFYIQAEVVANLKKLINTYKSPCEFFQVNVFALKDKVMQHFAIYKFFEYQNVLSAYFTRKQLCQELDKLCCIPTDSDNFLTRLISSIGNTEELEATKQLKYLSTLIRYSQERPAIQPVLHLITGISLDKLSV